MRSFEKFDESDIMLDDAGQHRHKQVLGRLLWLDQLSIPRRHSLVGNLACNMMVGCDLDVPGIAGTPQSSVLVMSDADSAGDLKDRRSYSGIAACINGSVEDTWYLIVYASSKKQNIVCLSSGVSEFDGIGR